MPRPFREWTTLNCTISLEVDQFLRHQAAALGIDTGTVLDVLIWRNHLQPAREDLGSRRFPPEVLERCFAEEALALLEDDKAIEALDEVLDIEGPQSVRRRKVQSHVRRWQKTRQIPQEFKFSVKEMMSRLEVVPLILKMDAVDEAWFDAPE